jgi:hypothetical protein
MVEIPVLSRTPITLIDWAQECDTLKKVLQKAKNQNLEIIINKLQDNSSFKIVESKKDYAIISQENTEIYYRFRRMSILPNGSDTIYRFDSKKVIVDFADKS